MDHIYIPQGKKLHVSFVDDSHADFGTEKTIAYTLTDGVLTIYDHDFTPVMAFSPAAWALIRLDDDTTQTSIGHAHGEANLEVAEVAA